MQAICEYKGAQPIKERIAIGFAFGRGPLAKAVHKDYRYWVAVTVRNLAVLNKTYFTVRPTFHGGSIGWTTSITSPTSRFRAPRRASAESNFEILVGFDVTPEMADFNRLGKRFRVNARVAMSR